MQDEIVRLLPLRKGHFRLESGHHGDLWIDLELLCADPQPVRRYASEMGARLIQHSVEVICGPLVEGAFVGLLAAAGLGLPFCYSERVEPDGTGVQGPEDQLYPVPYRIPRPLRPRVRGKRVAVVNDVINAGSAVRGTITDLDACEAEIVVVAALLVLGSWAHDYTQSKAVPLETLAALPNTVWAPAECPLCSSGVPLDN